MPNSNQPLTNSGLTFEKYDEYRPLDVDHIRGEMLDQWDHEATDEEVAGVIDYIEENAWTFLYDAIESVLAPRKPCPDCGQPETKYKGDTAQDEVPHP